MLFEALLWSGYAGQKLIENGRHGQMTARVSDEKHATTLAFRLDGESNVREALGIANDLCCDGLFLSVKYNPAKAQARPEVALMFVELKGADVKHAVSQLTATLTAFRNALAENAGAKVETTRTRYVAVVVSSSALPLRLATSERRPVHSLGAKLHVVAGHRNGTSTDLTTYLWESERAAPVVR